jgi:hypothetical protein
VYLYGRYLRPLGLYRFGFGLSYAFMPREPFLFVSMNEKDRFIYDCEFANHAMRVIDWFKERGIEPLLIKGWLAAQNYPKTQFRDYGDIDLIVPIDIDRETALRAEEQFPDVVDVHIGPRNHDTLTYDKLSANSELKKLLNGFEIRVVSPEDHLRILSVHWLNDGGIAKAKLWDIYYAVKNRPNSFDWSKCLDVVSPVRRKWVLAVILLTHHYFELPIDDLPFAAEIKSPNFVPNWVFNTIEKEWESNIPLLQLVNSFGSSKSFYEQLKKRIIPNPIQSAIFANAAIDDSSRIPSHLKATFIRAINIPTIAFTIYRKRRIAKKIGPQK